MGLQEKKTKEKVEVVLGPRILKVICKKYFKKCEFRKGDPNSHLIIMRDNYINNLRVGIVG